MSDSSLVYSTDPERNRKCPRCKHLMPECVCAKAEAAGPDGAPVLLRIEKSGRGGKTVTVVDGLPRQEKYLKDFSSYLKARCGAGGTYGTGSRGGFVEIQGDKRDQVRDILASKGIVCKG